MVLEAWEIQPTIALLGVIFVASLAIICRSCRMAKCCLLCFNKCQRNPPTTNNEIPLQPRLTPVNEGKNIIAALITTYHLDINFCC